MNDGRRSGALALASRAQQGLWYLERLAAEPSANTIGRAYAVSGELDVPALYAAWRATAARHEALRTRFTEIDGVPCQRIEAGCDAPELIDLTATPEPAQADAAARLLAGLAGALHARDGGPLARFTVLRFAPSEHALLLVLHRLVADESTMRMLVAELAEYYSAAVEGREAELPFVPLQYRDYAIWEDERRDSSELRRLAGWWSATLASLPPELDLPGDRPADREPVHAARAVHFDWGRETAQRLREVCAAEATAPADALLTAFQALLFRHTGEERIAVGYPAVVRPRPEFAQTAGPFENPLVLCADFAGAPTFRHMLARTAQTRQAALDHRDLPFPTLVAALDVDRAAHRTPLFDAVFACDETAEPAPRLAGVSVRPLAAPITAVPSGLELRVRMTEPTVAGTLAHRADLFDENSAEHLLDQLRTLLEAALKDPDQPVTALPLETPEQLRAAVHTADRVADAPNVHPTVAAAVHQHAGRAPDAPALVWPDATLSYRELTDLAASISRGLRRLGGVAGAAVAVRTPTGPRQSAALLGVMEAGAHLVWLGTGEAGERGQLILGDLRPPYLLLDTAPEDDPLAVWFRDELGGRPVTLAELAERDEPPADGSADAEPDAEPDAESGTEPDAEDPGRGLAYIAYTSGSTGRPKGITQSHDGFAQFCEWMAAHFAMAPGSRVAQWAAAGYDAALCEIFAALGSGAALCPVPERVRVDPRKLVRWLAEERITHFQTVPSFAREVLRAMTALAPGERPDALEHLLLAGEPLPGELAGRLREALPGVRLTNLYGPTEVALATWHEVTGPVRGTVPVGESIPGRQVIVVDGQDRPCPAGVTGELVIRSPYVSPGYVGADGGDAFAPLRRREEFGIAPGSWYRTGDLGRRRWDGLLEFRGRQDFQIKFFGTRLELTDIEAALSGADDVAECAVVPVRDHAGLVVRLVAYVVPHAGSEPEGDPSAGWRAQLRRRFGTTVPPVTFRTMTSLPRNVGGKVDRRKLPAPASLRAPGDDRAATPTEAALGRIWAELLGTDQILPESSFFALGGHSLLVPVLLHRVRERAGAAPTARAFLADPTLAGLGALVDAAPRPAADQARSRRGRPPRRGSDNM
ncbi:AMP-binding protein [Actinoallomurus sp. NPDC050550]|uniref:non-ribosomal peptide synthetase n=1 Tax=Actinoallomurus sp. NPDC050550 TaxID=3154937 RepID=UPI0033FB8531